METYTEKAIKAIATGNAPAEQAALEAVIAEAVKKAVKETRRQDQQQALHNTALLMENYRALKGYEGRAVDSADAARLQGAEIQGEAWLRSIRKNKARTAVMLAHLTPPWTSWKRKPAKGPRLHVRRLPLALHGGLDRRRSG